jgi:hypothetical protein
MSGTERPALPLLLAINAVAILLVAMTGIAYAVAVMIIPAPGTAMSFISAASFGLFLGVFGAFAYRSVFSRRRTAAEVAAAFYFICSGFSFVSLIATVCESLSKGREPNFRFLLAFAVTSLALSAYGILSGILSLRWGRRLASPAKAGVPKDDEATSQPGRSAG